MAYKKWHLTLDHNWFLRQLNFPFESYERKCAIFDNFFTIFEAVSRFSQNCLHQIMLRWLHMKGVTVLRISTDFFADWTFRLKVVYENVLISAFLTSICKSLLYFLRTSCAKSSSVDCIWKVTLPHAFILIISSIRLSVQKLWMKISWIWILQEITKFLWFVTWVFQLIIFW